MTLTKFSISRNEPTLPKSAYEFFEENGFVVLTDFLSEVEVAEVRAKVEELATHEIQASKAHIYGDNLQRVWNLVSKDQLFRDLLLSPQLDLWMNKIFDRETVHQKYYLSSYQANILHPGATEQILHVDTPIPEPIPPYPIKANTIWVIDEFTEYNGATEVIPETHNETTRPPRHPNASLVERLIKVTAPSGTVIITHGNLWHRSGANKSLTSRVALLGSYAASYAREIACEEDAARFLPAGLKETMDQKLYEIIGGNHGVKPGNDYGICISGTRQIL